MSPPSKVSCAGAFLARNARMMTSHCGRVIKAILQAKEISQSTAKSAEKRTQPTDNESARSADLVWQVDRTKRKLTNARHDRLSSREFAPRPGLERKLRVKATWDFTPCGRASACPLPVNDQLLRS